MKYLKVVIATMLFQLIALSLYAQHLEKLKTLSVNVSLDYIQCTRANDGVHDYIAEVYGAVNAMPGPNICPEGESSNPMNFNGSNFILIKPMLYKKMKKGQKLALNKKASWSYTIPDSCGIIGDQELVKLTSEVHEFDYPKEDTLGNYFTTHTVKLSQVLNSKVRTFEFTQSHSDQGSNFDVHFTVKVYLRTDPKTVVPKPN